jgi:anti-sigma-K factor RskA
MLLAANMKSPLKDHVYQLWLIHKTGLPVSIGYLRPDEFGWAQVVFRSPGPLSQFTSLLVTMELDSNDGAPTTVPLFQIDF